MQEASAKGKSAHPKGRSDAMAPDRPRTWPIGSAVARGASPKPQHLWTVKGRGLGTSEGAAAKIGWLRPDDRRESQPERKPDAGASAGDKSPGSQP